MNFALSQNIEKFGSPHVSTARDEEYLVFSRVTRQLKDASDRNDRYAMIRAANASNQLWTAMATDLAHPENRLPPETKAGLLSLAFFSLRQGHRILLENASADPLIEVNIRIMKGLRGDTSP